MNVHTFKDATTDRRSALVNELVEDDDDEEDDRVTEGARRRGTQSYEGEEEGVTDKYDDMGGTVEPFNLKNEREIGGFDENMNFVFHKEEGEVDPWLADMDESEMEKGIGEAAKAHKLRQDKMLAEDRAEDKKQETSTSALKSELLGMLKPGENVWQAIKRLGSKGNSNKKSTADGDDNSTGQLNRLTELADLLLGRGDTNIYEMSREGIVLSDIEWEYQGNDGKVYGPYKSSEIQGWVNGGFFTGDGAVLIRRARCSKVTSTNKKKVAWSDVSDDGGGYEESKGGDAKRRRQGHDNHNGGPSSKRNRLESTTSAETCEDLINDLDDSDDEAEGQNSALQQQNNSENTTNMTVYDEYSEWQSSDDIDWSSILDAKEGGDQV